VPTPRPLVVRANFTNSNTASTKQTTADGKTYPFS
jgi:hypothetical protein